ncbi:MAG: hypothetical protein ACAI35_08055 [Candidatus Methylacidiphilales bacterium]|nr:hypothetical protein [Candidatus Methylacidiphilales bacterium]
MPFAFNDIVERFNASKAANRLGHAYLLTGANPGTLEKLGKTLARGLLDKEPHEHPDFHLVQPSSKSRRISVEQIRNLEKSLFLKAYSAPTKVALILWPERMCLGQAEPANAFLKTLEEPPASTLILLASTRPQLLLPTIISRCLRIDLVEGDQSSGTANSSISFHNQLVQQWFAIKANPSVYAYSLASLLSDYWRDLRQNIQDSFEENAGEDEDEDTLKALLEAEFQLARQDSLMALIEHYRTQVAGFASDPARAEPCMRAILALEDLHQALQQNMDQALAMDRTCLKIADLL